MIKIHIPPIEKFENQKNKGEYNHIIKDGVLSNPRTELTNSGENADYIFLDFRHINQRSGYNINNLNKDWLHKTVIIDYSDDANISMLESPFYFKRSIVDKGSTLEFKKYKRNVIPISYCVRNECLNFKIKPIEKRDYDISVFFRTPDKMNKSGMNNRAIVAKYVQDNFNNYNIWVGVAGVDGEAGRMSQGNDSYYNTMLNSKIVVNCNPDMWEGDYRLFEALSCGSAVFSDPMITPVINPLINEKDLVYYDTLELLGDRIIYYLNNMDELQKIASSGYNKAMKYHKSSDRIDEILNIILKR